MKLSALACFIPLLVGGVCQLPAAEKLVLFAGGSQPISEKGVEKATQVKLTEPFGIDFDRQGSALICEMGGGRVLKVDPHDQLSVLAGTGKVGNSGDGGPASAAVFNNMHSLTVLPSGDLLLADTWNNRVRQIDAKSGIIRNLIGTGEKGFSGDDGPGENARFGGIYCVALDRKAERLYLTDLDNHRIRMYEFASRKVSTVAGNGKKGKPDDGVKATDAPLTDPRAACVDSQGNLYILERGGNALRVVDVQGKIRTVAGTGKKGNSGDDGPAIAAEMNGPKHLCCDDRDNVLICDTENHLVRRYQPADGKIVRVAGTGKPGTAGLGGSPLEAQLNRPHGVYFDATRGLYICDSYNHRVLRIEKSPRE